MNKKLLNQKNQEGMTFIGVVIMFLFVGFLLLAVLRIFPLYYENFAVQKSLENFAIDYSENSTKLSTTKALRTALQRRFDTQDVVNLKAEDVKFKKTRGGFTLDASYQPVANYLANLNFMIDFEHIVELEK